jgi:hypothetical protein
MKHPLISFGLHIALAPIWATLSVTQLIPSLRSRYPAAHRICGRVFLLISLSLGVTGFLFLWLDMAFTHQNEASHWIHPFTLTGISVPLVTAFLCSGTLAIHHARAHRFVDHRVWILRHMAIGYSVIVMRWILALASIVYPLAFDMPSPGSQGISLVELRKILFGLAMWAGAACSVAAVEVYLRMQTRSSLPQQKLRNA